MDCLNPESKAQQRGFSQRPAPSAQLLRLALIAYTVVFTLWIGSVFGSDRLYSMSFAAQTGKISPEKGIALLEIAMRLTPGDARLYAQKYDLMPRAVEIGRLMTDDRRLKPGDLLYERQLQVIARCIDLCPSVASYHFHYALTMRMVLPCMTIPAIRYLLSEYEKASELRPGNVYFRSTYQKYEARYGGAGE